MLSNIHMHDGFLHSHMSENDIKKDILLLSTEFIDGFTQSNDKMAYLKLSDFPNEKLSRQIIFSYLTFNCLIKLTPINPAPPEIIAVLMRISLNFNC